MNPIKYFLVISLIVTYINCQINLMGPMDLYKDINTLQEAEDK
jgi:hypothetical protein